MCSEWCTISFLGSGVIFSDLQSLCLGGQTLFTIFFVLPYFFECLFRCAGEFLKSLYWGMLDFIRFGSECGLWMVRWVLQSYVVSSPPKVLSMQTKLSVCFRSGDFSGFSTRVIKLETMVGVSLSKCKCISTFLVGTVVVTKFLSSRLEWWSLEFYDWGGSYVVSASFYQKMSIHIEFVRFITFVLLCVCDTWSFCKFCYLAGSYGRSSSSKLLNLSEAFRISRDWHLRLQMWQVKVFCSVGLSWMILWVEVSARFLPFKQEDLYTFLCITQSLCEFYNWGF